MRLLLDENDDFDNDVDDEYSELSPKTQAKVRRQSMAAAQKQRQSKQRRRRRSSARFLRLGPTSASGGGQSNPEQDGDEDDGGFADGYNTNDDDLGAMYQKAIRMNAENRINASNSWNLSLIDHLDRFLTVNGGSGSQTNGGSDRSDPNAPGNDGTVNFTRASCTLDASVKIYSYRVDDVHLTSYKVLANLNRTETSNKKNGNVGDTSENDAADPENSGNAKAKKSSTSSNHGPTDTLEHNLGKFLANLMFLFIMSGDSFP